MVDILQQYEKEHPGAFRQAPSWEPPQEYGFFIRWVMKLSGGRIRDVRSASYILLGFAALAIVVSLVLFFKNIYGPSKPPAGYRGNIPDLPEYRNPPTPQDFR